MHATPDAAYIIILFTSRNSNLSFTMPYLQESPFRDNVFTGSPFIEATLEDPSLETDDIDSQEDKTDDVDSQEGPSLRTINIDFQMFFHGIESLHNRLDEELQWIQRTLPQEFSNHDWQQIIQVKYVYLKCFDEYSAQKGPPVSIIQQRCSWNYGYIPFPYTDLPAAYYKSINACSISTNFRRRG